jgi:hypothetical protein
VTSWDPLRVWWWGTCYLRFAAERYDAASTDIFSHLTNNSVTKHFIGDLPNGEPASCVALPIGRAAQMSDNCLLALAAIPQCWATVRFQAVCLNRAARTKCDYSSSASATSSPT